MVCVDIEAAQCNMKRTGKRRHFFTHPVSDNLQVAKLWNGAAVSPTRVHLSSIRQILMAGGMRAGSTVTEGPIRSCRQASLLMLLIVFLLSLQWPQCHRTYVWTAVWHYSLRKIDRPVELFIFSSMCFVNRPKTNTTAKNWQEASQEQQRWAGVLRGS